jgi:RNA polymerase sigma-70 factor, ECF subfamily
MRHTASQLHASVRMLFSSENSSSRKTSEVDDSENPNEPPVQLRELVLRIASRDEAALSVLYDQTNRFVHGVILRIVLVRAIAEEVTLDVYLQVWRQAAQYQESRGTVFTWLALLARSRALDRLRSEKLSQQSTWEYFSEGFELAASGASPEQLVDVQKLQVRMAAILQELPTEQKTVIQLSFYEG